MRPENKVAPYRLIEIHMNEYRNEWTLLFQDYPLSFKAYKKNHTITITIDYYYW